MQIRNLCKFEPAGQTANCIEFLAMLIELGIHMNRENWETVYDAIEVDDKVNAFTCTIVRMIDK